MREKPKNSANNIGGIAIVGIIVGVVLFFLGLGQRADKGSSGMLIAGLVILCLSILLILVARLMKQSTGPQSPDIMPAQNYGGKEAVGNAGIRLAPSKPYEKDIQNYIPQHLDLLESGLRLIEAKYRLKTPQGNLIGEIDILCEGRDGAYVVVEIKRRKESDEVVGQIQRYMSWVDEHLAKGRRVRGIIVTSDTDKKLEYSRMGSKYQIDILPFGTSPPTDDNLKHCNNCGRPNPKSARYCQGCGKLLWM